MNDKNIKLKTIKSLNKLYNYKFFKLINFFHCFIASYRD